LELSFGFGIVLKIFTNNALVIYSKVLIHQLKIGIYQKIAISVLPT
jgi:hypothetical protein